MAQADYFLKFDGDPGRVRGLRSTRARSTSSRGPSVRSQAGSMSYGEGRGAGKVSMQDFTSPCGQQGRARSSSRPAPAASTSRQADARLPARRARPAEFLKIKFTDLLVSSFDRRVGRADPLPIDSISLNFSKIEYEYTPGANADGSLGGVTRRASTSRRTKALTRPVSPAETRRPPEREAVLFRGPVGPAPAGTAEVSSAWPRGSRSRPGRARRGSRPRRRRGTTGGPGRPGGRPRGVFQSVIRPSFTRSSAWAEDPG